MSHLVLELRPGEMMVVNGATIRFRSKCRVELVSQARFLFGKQVMAPHEAETEMRRLYYELQTAYVGAAEERDEASRAAWVMLDRLKAELPRQAAASLHLVEESLGRDDFYRALKLLRYMIQEEGQARAPSAEGY